MIVAFLKERSELSDDKSLSQTLMKARFPRLEFRKYNDKLLIKPSKVHQRFTETISETIKKGVYSLVS